MQPEYFADAVVSVSFIGPTVRMDFASVAQPGEWTPTRNDQAVEERPPLLKRFRVIIPVEGFIQVFSAQESLMERLVSSGIVPRSTRS
jgi:hypothetical protein